MGCTGLFISLVVFVYTRGNEARNPTLSHVTKYDVIRIQALTERSRRSVSALKTHPDRLEYAFAVDGGNYTLSLRRNRELLGNNYTLSHYTGDGISESSSTNPQNHCFYQGHIHGIEDSSVSIGICSGMRGFIKVLKQMYLIEPLEDSLEGDHAIYKEEHLRFKECAIGYTNDTVYDLGPKYSGLYKGKILKHKSSSEGQRIVELVVVVDQTEYKKFASLKKIEERMMLVANHVDKLYRPLNVRVMLVGLEVWSKGDQIHISQIPNITLDNFLKWRQDILLRRKKHDNAQFVTGVDFEGSTVGLATMNSMCSPSSGAVNEDHNVNPIAVASTIAHEMGHNLGMSHDEGNCACSSAKTCVMGESIGHVYPESFSPCSQNSLRTFLENYDSSCLFNAPNNGELYGGPVCGNAFVEKGEECDCGTVEECNTHCCNASTCRLTDGAVCAHGDCCHDCQLKHSGSLCRQSAHDCDLEEFCTGESAFCPEDEFKMNGLPCKSNQGYCYNGQCPTHKEHCKLLWGSDAVVDVDTCFRYNVLNGISRSAEHMKCGKIYCYGGNLFPITKNKKIITLNTRTCNIAVDLSSSEDLGMVPKGTKCGLNKVCYNGLCLDVSIYGIENCSDKCNNRGVCNHERKCHCDPEWAPPYCDVKHSDLHKVRQAVILGVTASLVVLILIVIIGALACFRNKITTFTKTRSLKNIHTSSGQCNPAFQPGSAKNSPRVTQPRISQPKFLESSTTLVCKPLYPQSVPCRQAPPPPEALQKRTVPTVNPPAPYPGINQKAYSTQEKLLATAKPHPPSRPLPPLMPKPVTKPKSPPVPPLKPSKTLTCTSTQVMQKVALKPPVRL